MAFQWGLFLLKKILQESSPAGAKHAQPTVEFAGEHYKPQRSGS